MSISYIVQTLNAGALREINALFQHWLHILGHNAFMDNTVNKLSTFHFMSIVLKYYETVTDYSTTKCH